MVDKKRGKGAKNTKPSEKSIKMEKWREEHPQAKFVEIEEAVDQRLAQLRHQMIAD
jgi:hypothetical protein